MYADTPFLARLDEQGAVAEFTVPAYASYPYKSATAILDSQGNPRVAAFKVADGGDKLVVRSALLGEPEVEALRDTTTYRARAARLPGVLWPAFVVDERAGYRIAYPTASGYREVAVPDTQAVETNRCVCNYPSSWGPCRDLGVRRYEPALAAAAGALWLVWIHEQADRDLEFSGFKGCGTVTVLADRSRTEVVVARVTEGGVEVKRRFPVANPQVRTIPRLDARAIDEHLVIGVITVPSIPEVLVVDTSKL